MSFNLAPYHVLARNGRNWHILRLGDGRVQINLGLFAVALQPDAFQLLRGLVEAALNSPTPVGCVAHAGVERSIWFDAKQGALLLAFDGVVLRLRPHELQAFAVLCREAGAKLDSDSSQPPSDFCHN